ncbi:DUF4232 domain-containing protein [Actinocatenispora rupis]|uniref:DUF4232 domain-containing protein n=1 Tax=Actinocatenispora rupis TaxID=519421 RepID=A0A8J3J7D3_9ACTN|nr:DUF4232 domain-containing protein [Actinocatenispora rupis]GID11439.1 hypothetical protein Aru02nite_23280 [Actinocatenispora rupis]
MRVRTAALAVLVAAAGAVVAPAVAHAAPVCQGSRLSVGQNLDGHQEGMLHRGVDVTVTNAGHDPCVLDGYLGIALLDRDGHPLATTVHKGPTYFESDPGPRAITVPPDTTLAADLAWRLPSAPSDPHVTPAYLRVTTPGATDGAFTVPFAVGPVYRGDLDTTALSPFTGPRP